MESIETTSKNRLEEVLDTYFPKIEEEGEAKKANKRGEALVLFAEATLPQRKPWAVTLLIWAMLEPSPWLWLQSLPVRPLAAP